MLRKMQTKISLPGFLLALVLMGGVLSAGEKSAEVSDDVAKARDSYAKAMREIEKDRENFKAEQTRYCSDLEDKIATADDGFFERLMHGIRRAEARWFSTDPRAESEVAGATATSVTLPGGTTRVSQVCVIGDDELNMVLTARENLENNVYQRNLAAIARESAADGQRPERGRRGWFMRSVDGMGRDGTYQNSRTALIDLQKAVEDKIQAERSVLEKRAAILQDAAKADITAEQKADYDKRLQALDEDKRIAEERYQIQYNYIDSRLALEQFMAREVGRLEARREMLDRIRSGQTDELAAMRKSVRDVEKGRALPSDAKTVAKDATDNISAIAKMSDKEYAEAVASLENRREMIIRAVQARLEYLDETNRVRMRIAGNPDKAESSRLIRGEIEGIEDRQRNRESALREQMVTAFSMYPVFYRVDENAGSDVARMRDSIDSRVVAAGRHLGMRYDRDSKMLRDRMDSVAKRLSDSNLTDSAKQFLEQEKQSLSKLSDDLQSQFKSTSDLLGNYRDSVKKAFADSGKAGTAMPEDIAKLEQQYLNQAFDMNMRQIRSIESSHPLGYLLSPDRSKIQAANPYVGTEDQVLPTSAANAGVVGKAGAALAATGAAAERAVSNAASAVADDVSRAADAVAQKAEVAGKTVVNTVENAASNTAAKAGEAGRSLSDAVSKVSADAKRAVSNAATDSDGVGQSAAK